MSQQLAFDVEPPLTFVARSLDGRVLAEIPVAPGGSWHEASCWAYVEIKADRDRLAYLATHTCRRAAP